jgi:hypothetical protein
VFTLAACFSIPSMPDSRIRDIAFGTIEITVHQSRIVQITRSEKLRL